MSEKMQRHSESIREQMLNRYGDELPHKHNKSRRPYRVHSRTHPCETPNHLKILELKNHVTEEILREFKLRKVRTRERNGGIH